VLVRIPSRLGSKGRSCGHGIFEAKGQPVKNSTQISQDDQQTSGLGLGLMLSLFVFVCFPMFSNVFHLIAGIRMD
jgi:hypothetical protein